MSRQISDSTRAQYVKILNALKRSARTGSADDRPGEGDQCVESISYDAIVDAFLADRVRWSRLTERVNKCALLFFLDAAIAQVDLPAYEAKRKLLGLLNPKRDLLGHFSSHAERDQAIERAAETERHRQAHLRSGDVDCARAVELSVLLATLGQSRSKWKEPTSAWLKASLLTGLGPRQWLSASLQRDENGRHVLHAAARRPSAHGGCNAVKLRLDRLTCAQLAVVEEHLAGVSSWHAAQQFDDFYSACRGCLQAAASKCGLTKITLNPSRFLLGRISTERLAPTEVALLAI